MSELVQAGTAAGRTSDVAHVGRKRGRLAVGLLSIAAVIPLAFQPEWVAAMLSLHPGPGLVVLQQVVFGLGLVFCGVAGVPILVSLIAVLVLRGPKRLRLLAAIPVYLFPLGVGCAWLFPWGWPAQAAQWVAWTNTHPVEPRWLLALTVVLAVVALLGGVVLLWLRRRSASTR